MMIRALFILSLLTVGGVAPSFAAQEWRGTIRGLVVDQSGARLAGARMVVRSEATGAVREMTSGPAANTR